MKKRIVSEIMLTLLLASILTLPFNIQPVRSHALLNEDSTETVLGIQPDHIIAPIGTTFVANITVTNVTDLYHYGVRLLYDPNIIDVVGKDVILVDTWFDPGYPRGSFWASVGAIGFWVESTMSGKGVNGSGTIAQIQFTVVGTGLTSIVFNQTWWTEGLWDSKGNEIPYTTRNATFKTGIPISLDIFPSTLNLKSKGRWISGHIELVGGHNVGDIDVSTILLNDEVPAESVKVGGKKLSVKFDRSRAIASLPQVGEVELTVTGKLFNGTLFEGSDSIRVK